MSAAGASKADHALAVAIRDLMLANRILAHEDVLDAYGHVSVRHPTKPGAYLLSRSRSPELVEPDDILEHDFAGDVEGIPEPQLYRERFIHGAIYEARPDVNAVVHSHAEAVLPFSISKTTRLQPVFHGASGIGSEIPVWDIREKFGDTNLLVSNVEQGRDLARRLDGNDVALMRGHGFAAGAATLLFLVIAAANLPRNARIYMDALRLGEVVTLSPGEIALRRDAFDPRSPANQRAWEYWSRQLGVPYEPGGFTPGA
jgi:ribulose-5-phosphate 4-epimerase/fuculose-1-phosphate aldolase